MRTEYLKLKIEIRDGVAVIVMDNPPVNQMSPDFSLELTEALTEAIADTAVQAVVLTGVGRNFIAGADITRLQKITDRDSARRAVLEAARFLSRIETAPKPVIAAINGFALGGGLETAMVCHWRVAVMGAEMGQPEVKIGVIPGAGGTQRLPRLVGLPLALEMITIGESITAEKGFAAGLIDELAGPEELLDKALAAARRFVSGELVLEAHRTRNRNDKLPSAQEKAGVIAFARDLARQKAKGYLAPFKALEAMEMGLGPDIDGDIEREVDLFCDCAVSDVAKYLIGLFLGTRAAGRLPRIKDVAPRPLKKAAVLGGGVMGSGIVHLLLRHGFETVLWEIDGAALDKALAAVRATFAWHLQKGRMTEAELEGLVKDRLSATTRLEDLGGAGLIVEAVVEDMRVKQDIWKKLEGFCPAETVFGTNTSALPITAMAEVLADPGRLIGLHFFNPAHRMQLLEIICGKKTSDQTLADSVAFARAIKKIPLVVNDGPGFYVSRQLGGLMGGAVYLTADGVSGAAVEEAV
ncbi:MAG: 3-hydroxyacyl-CoA dehydrogenase NAD-binding domain-containing protein, partial [Thermodesulfobacteriota bacterium]